MKVVVDNSAVKYLSGKNESEITVLLSGCSA